MTNGQSVRLCDFLINQSECPVALLGAEKDAEEQQRVHARRELVVLVDGALLVVTFSQPGGSCSDLARQSVALVN